LNPVKIRRAKRSQVGQKGKPGDPEKRGEARKSENGVKKTGKMKELIANYSGHQKKTEQPGELGPSRSQNVGLNRRHAVKKDKTVGGGGRPRRPLEKKGEKKND